MPTFDERQINFYAGQAAMPLPVLERARDEILNWRGTGMSVMEISHRAPAFIDFMAETESLVREVLSVPDEYAVLFLPGGGRLQFSMVPLNLLAEPTEKANYAVTGQWSKAAAAEAKRLANVHVCCQGADNDFKALPVIDTWSVDPSARYLHYCDNETVHGVEFSAPPLAAIGGTDQVLVADMSSNLLTKRINVSDFGIIYACAQKTLGTAGVTLAIVRKDLIREPTSKQPMMLSYDPFFKKDSAYNTPPCWPIYILNGVLDWVKAQGGLDAMESTNREKAKHLYAAIDASTLFTCRVAEADRSRVNVIFNADTPEREKVFIASSTEAGFVGLKGHRDLGGMRASIYNAISLEQVDQLISFMHDFEKNAG